jgi:DoxX-like protein
VGERAVADRVSAGEGTTKGMFRTGWALTGFVGLFLLVDGGGRLAQFRPYVEGMTQFGYDTSLAPWIGLVLIVSTCAMLVPRTAVLGCILVTGYLGGAVASQVRVQHDGWFLFPVALGAAAWLGLFLRDARLRALIPIRQTP